MDAVEVLRAEREALLLHAQRETEELTETTRALRGARDTFGRVLDAVLLSRTLERADVLTALEYAAAIANEREVPIARPAGERTDHHGSPHVHVLFVCTGNICRSPTAERLTRAFAAGHGLDALTASSAGTGAVVGYGMEPSAAEVLRSLGGDPAGFRARQLSPAMVDDAELVLTMTTKHRDKVLAQSLRALRRTFTLLEVGRLLTLPADGDTLVQRLTQARAQQPRGERVDDIADPYGRDRATFEAIGATLVHALQPVLPALESAS